MAIPRHIIDILRKRLKPSLLTEEEQSVLEEWFASGEADTAVFDDSEWQKDLWLYRRLKADSEKNDQALKRFMTAADFSNQNVIIQPAHRVHFLRKWWWAAAIILLAGAGAYRYTTNTPKEPVIVKRTDTPAEGVLPGSEKAILTLADGRQITLDNVASGSIARQGSAEVVKLDNGGIKYDLKGISEEEVGINTMSTPRGGQYKLILPDGTKVWLNAASSITFPAVFAGSERKVKVTGEVYMEVAQNKAKPFFVDIDSRSSIQVLGTSFNINSYADEGEIQTTLVEGSVKVNKQTILKPGQQAVQSVSTAGIKDGDIKVQSANIEKTLAWKNGIFNFDGKPFSAVMKDVERWYDIDVRYENEIPAFRLKGKMDRSVQLADFLRFIATDGLDARLDGRTLIIRSS